MKPAMGLVISGLNLTFVGGFLPSSGHLADSSPPSSPSFCLPPSLYLFHSLISLIEDRKAPKALGALRWPQRATASFSISFPPLLFLFLSFLFPHSIFANI